MEILFNNNCFNNDVNNNIFNYTISNAALSSKAENHFIYTDDEKLYLSLYTEYWEKNTITLKEADQLEELFAKRSSLCGIGTKRVKKFLASKAKEGDMAAKVLNVALKAEDKRISSLMCSSRYRSHSVNMAAYLLAELLHLIDDSGIGGYGFLGLQHSDFNVTGNEVARELCIDLPGDEQLGYVVPGWLGNRPFKGEVKNPHRTNLAKLEDAINRLYGVRIVEKYGSTGIAVDVKLPNVVILREEENNRAYVLEPKVQSKNAFRRIAPSEKMDYNEFLISNSNKNNVLAVN